MVQVQALWKALAESPEAKRTHTLGPDNPTRGYLLNRDMHYDHQTFCSRMHSTVCDSSQLETPTRPARMGAEQLRSSHTRAFQTTERTDEIYTNTDESHGQAIEPKKPDPERYTVHVPICINFGES